MLRPAQLGSLLRPISQRALISRAPSRGLSSTTALLRRLDEDRLPRGYVRPHRRRDLRGYEGPQPGGFPGSGFGELQAQAPVIVPADPGGVLNDSHAAMDVLAHDSLVVVRQLEMMNVFMGFEQANKYALYSSDGQVVGFLAEEEKGMGAMMTRQFLHTHRPLKATVMDKHGTPVLWIHRPFNLINSRIKVFATQENDTVVGETQQIWHPWRRKYDLFQNRPRDHTMEQFAQINGQFLAWDFWLKDRHDRLVATINRNFAGFGREIFTDTGQYVIRFDAAGTELDIPRGSEVNIQGQTIVLPPAGAGGLTLDQRAMTLATAVSIDFDYFSRHSGSGGMGLPFFMWGGGDGSSEARRQGGGDGDTGIGPGVAGAAGGAAAGAASRPNDGSQEEWTDDQIYGRQPGSTPQDTPVPGQQAEGFDYPDQWGNNVPEGEDIFEDPWAGGGGDSGGGGGDWGDWGDWS